MSECILGKGPAGDVLIDVGRLAQSRLLIQGGSGSGKSWAVRRILEQTHDRVQQIVLDLEDEYASLRERFDLLLGGPDRDFPVDPARAEALAARILELNVSAIVSLHELPEAAQRRFVAAFLRGLVAAPVRLHRQALVVVEEAQRLAPESGGDPQCTSALIDLLQRGRKRGLIGIAVTRRIGELHRSVAQLAQSRLVGGTTLERDIARAATDLGIMRGAGRRLTELAPGRFLAFGPALSKQVIEIQIGPVLTTHGRAGARKPRKLPRPSRRARALLAKLVDLPAAVAAAEPGEALRTRIAELEAELRAAQAALSRKAQLDVESACEKAYQRGWAAGQDAQARADRKRAQRAGDRGDGAGAAQARSDRERADASAADSLPQTARSADTAPRARAAAPAVSPRQQRILDAVASLAPHFEGSAPRALVAAVAGTGHWISSFERDCHALRAAGLIASSRGSGVSLTAEGTAQARVSTVKELVLHRAILDRLLPRQERLMVPLLQRRGAPLSRATLAAEVGARPGDPDFERDLGWLRSIAGLVDCPEPDLVQAAPGVFMHPT